MSTAAKPLRVITSPVLVAAPKGARIRTRLQVTAREDAALREVGAFLGGLYRADLAERLDAGRLDAQGKAESRRERKRALTAATSSRWAGSITRASEDQYQLGVRGLAAEIQMLRAATKTLRDRCALEPGDRIGRVKGYRNRTEWATKTRRLATLESRLDRTQDRFDAGRPSLAVGGRRLWRNRNHLAAAGLTEAQWRARWDAERMFLTADGEGGKRFGNETTRITADGVVTVKVPTALVEKHGTHLTLQNPVRFAHRSAEWETRVAANRSVRYDITYDPDKGRWYIDASWSIEPSTHAVPLTTLRTQRILGVDLNADHLAAVVLDPSGNPVGAPHTIALNLKDIPATTRDGRLRAAITTLLDLAEQHQCAAVALENLNFDDARTTGRETMGRGARGKKFRATVAGIPTGKFRERLTSMAHRRGISLVGVDPAYTSRWGAQHWQTPLQQQTSDSEATRHHAAALAIGRRGQGNKIRRRCDGPRHGQRTMPGPPHTRPNLTVPLPTGDGPVLARPPSHDDAGPDR